jgi:hypothetical protein
VLSVEKEVVVAKAAKQIDINSRTTEGYDAKGKKCEIARGIFMSEMKRLTTDNPNSSTEWMHNMTVVKNREVYLREYDQEDTNLVEYCKNECKDKCGTEIDADVTEFGEFMDCDCIVARFYHMTVGYAENRERLKVYEDGKIDELKRCYSAEWVNGKCNGYQKSRFNDDPSEKCKICKDFELYEE